MLQIEGIDVYYGDVLVLKEVSLDVQDKELVAVIGANGAGKTTFVNMITGHLKPSKGGILFEDKDITGLPSRVITRLGISRSFQVAQVFPTMTVIENMRVASAIARGTDRMLDRLFTPLDTPETIAEADATIELFQIAAYRNARAATLPQGVRKLLDIAMAVAGAPRLLLLDEPTSGISIEEKFTLMEVVMSALKTRRMTVLFVEHDMDIVGRFADRVLAFYDGTVIADERPETVLANPRVQTLISGTRAAHLPGGVHV